MPNEGRRPRWNSPSTWIAVVASGAVAGAIALAMAPAHAEVAKATETLTVTGIEDGQCNTSVGGTTVHVRPGGTVVIRPSFARLSVDVPGIGPVSLDSGPVATFVDDVTIGTKHYELKATRNSTNKKIVLKHFEGTTNISWTSSKIVIAGSLLGDALTVDLTNKNTSVPAKGKLSWSGKIIASKNTDCGVQLQTPSISVSAPGISVGVPGQTLSAPNPVSSLTKVLSKLPHPQSSSNPAKHPSSGSAGGPPIKYTPPPTTVPQKVMSKAGNNPGGGGGGFVAPKAGNAGGGAAGPVRSSSSTGPKSIANPSPAAKINHAKSRHLAEPARLGGAQLPVLLAILAILALSMVTATYARRHLLKRHN